MTHKNANTECYDVTKITLTFIFIAIDMIDKRNKNKFNGL